MKEVATKCKPATKAELKWIEKFKKVCAQVPNKKLWLFSASGTLRVMKTPENDNEMNESGGVNPDNIIATVDIRNDGGDW